MPNTIRIKRSTGSAAPSSLANAELAFAEGSGALYIGVGTGGAGGTATTIPQIASSTLFASQSAGRVYASPSGASGAASFRALVISDTTGLQSALDLKAPLASPALTGTPTAPTQATSDNSTAIATTAWVKAQGYGVSNATGTVTSVGLSLPGLFSVSGSPVTTTGTLTATLATQTANTVFAGPSTGAAAAPTFRSLVIGDTTGLQSALDLKAPITSPSFGGTATFSGNVNFQASVGGDGWTLAQGGTSGFASFYGVTTSQNVTVGGNLSVTGSSAFGGNRLTNVGEPTAASDAATKNYVDTVSQGLDVKQSVVVATTANITLSGTQTIDGIAVAAGDRVLVKDQSTASQNGIYVVAAGAWTRATDFDAWAELPGAFFFVERGTQNSDNGYVCTSDPGGTLGTTAITFAQFSGAGQVTAGDGLTKTGNTLNVVAGTGISVANDDVALTGQALALHSLATSGLIVRTGAAAVSARSLATTSAAHGSFANGDGVSGNPTFSLPTSLSTIGGLTPAADRLAYYDGASSAALATLTSFGRSLIDDSDNTAARTTLGLGTMATQAASNVAITGGSIDNITIDGGSW